jgi:hypothetical protein
MRCVWHSSDFGPCVYPLFRVWLISVPPLRRVTFLSGKVTKTICSRFGPPASGPLTPATLRGHAANGHPWPGAASAASMPRCPLRAACVRPAPKSRLVVSGLAWMKIKSEARVALDRSHAPCGSDQRAERVLFAIGVRRFHRRHKLRLCEGTPTKEGPDTGAEALWLLSPGPASGFSKVTRRKGGTDVSTTIDNGYTHGPNREGCQTNRIGRARPRSLHASAAPTGDRVTLKSEACHTDRTGRA